MKNTQIAIPRLPKGTTLTDTHCHLDMDVYAKDLDSIISNAYERGVTRIITVGIDLPSSQKAVEIAGKFPGVFATVGCHPHNAAEGNDRIYAQLKDLAGNKRNRIVGYGEIGLDFARNYAPRDIQIDSFNRQLEVAKELEIPVIIHDRDAHDLTLEILKAHSPFPAGGVMHCFSGDVSLASEVLDLGFSLSIPGIVTFNNSNAMQEVARSVPLERMILETDGPFLAPAPFRGKTNRPEYLLYTAQRIAQLRETSLDVVARQTTLNAEKLFRLPHEYHAEDQR